MELQTKEECRIKEIYAHTMKVKLDSVESMSVSLLVAQGEREGIVSLETHAQRRPYLVSQSIRLNLSNEDNKSICDQFFFGEDFRKERRLWERKKEMSSKKTGIYELSVTEHRFLSSDYGSNGVRHLETQFKFTDDDGKLHTGCLTFYGEFYQAAMLTQMESLYLGFTEDLAEEIKEQMKLVFLIATGEKTKTTLKEND